MPEAAEQLEPPRLTQNPNGSWFCWDCWHLVILLDLDEHFCEATGTSTDLYTDEQRDAYYAEMAEEEA